MKHVLRINYLNILIGIKLRNKIMHGNENMLSQLSEGDLEALLDEIQYLYNDYFG